MLGVAVGAIWICFSRRAPRHTLRRSPTQGRTSPTAPIWRSGLISACRRRTYRARGGDDPPRLGDGRRQRGLGSAGCPPSKGIVAATIDYLLADGGPRHYWQTKAVDARRAARWLRSHAGELGVDLSPTRVLGESDRAHIALYFAAVGHTVPRDHSGALTYVSSSLACAVDNFRPTDTMWWPDKLLFGRDGQTSGRSGARRLADLHSRRERAAGNDRARP